jgi:hypothetical protein
VTALIELWTEKSGRADGHPFSASHDIYNAALDAIVSVAFGPDVCKSTTSTQIEFLSSLPSSFIKISENRNDAVEFPQALNPPELDAILTLTESLEPTIKSPVPRLHHWFLRQMPYMRKARALKECLINGQIEKATKRFAKGDLERRCALDDVMHREMTAANKAGRAPVYTTRPISDEVC